MPATEAPLCGLRIAPGGSSHALRAELASRLLGAPCPENLFGPAHGHLFSPYAVQVSRTALDGMAQVVRDVETLVRNPRFRSLALGDSAVHEDGSLGVLYGYDFHLTPNGPKLIEINTNAGGALLALLLGATDVRADWSASAEIASAITDSFFEDYARARSGGELRSLAIVDETPESQFLYPEFQLFQGLFRARGVEASIRSPEELQLRADGLYADGQARPLDLVYLRLTDFQLAAPKLEPLRQAWLRGLVVLTPAPHHHALYARKDHLALLSNPDALCEIGVSPELATRLAAHVPATYRVEVANRDQLWAARRSLFFKPTSGFGSKQAYRGAKLTRGVFDGFFAAGESFVAQHFEPPPEVNPGDSPDTALKVDIRNYTYNGKVQLVAARLYQGQTTNFRTECGGFARVIPT